MKMGNLMSPIKPKLRYITLMRVAFILMLIGNGISIFTILISSLDAINVFLGDPSLDWVLKIITFSNSLTLISTALTIAGSILLLIALVKISKSGNPKVRRNSRVAFLLLTVGLFLTFLFSFVLSSLQMWGYLSGEEITTILAITPLVIIGINSSFYIFLGFTIRKLKSEYKMGNKPLITTFIYPISFGLQLLLMFEIFPSMVVGLIASLVVSIMGLVILIVFFSRALIDMKRVKKKIRAGKQSHILPSRKDANFCAKCGASIEPIGGFCANCGHPIE